MLKTNSSLLSDVSSNRCIKCDTRITAPKDGVWFDLWVFMERQENLTLAIFCGNLVFLLPEKKLHQLLRCKNSCCLMKKDSGSSHCLHFLSQIYQIGWVTSSKPWPDVALAISLTVLSDCLKELANSFKCLPIMLQLVNQYKSISILRKGHSKCIYIWLLPDLKNPTVKTSVEQNELLLKS